MAELLPETLCKIRTYVVEEKQFSEKILDEHFEKLFEEILEKKLLKELLVKVPEMSKLLKFIQKSVVGLKEL